MKLNAHSKQITDCESWKKHCPPKKPDIQWRDGRSAKELARYITAALPDVPREIEEKLQPIVDRNACFDWDAEYVTPLPGVGEGRNHDAVLFNDDVVICIEAKADETLGNLIAQEMVDASVNKLGRIHELLTMFFNGGCKQYASLRYQLLTASAGSVIEAQKRNADIAVLLVIVFKSEEHTKKEKREANREDIRRFLNAVGAEEANGLYKIPNNTSVALYFGEIQIEI